MAAAATKRFGFAKKTKPASCGFQGRGRIDHNSSEEKSSSRTPLLQENSPKLAKSLQPDLWKLKLNQVF
jgi:hypothetical protein